LAKKGFFYQGDLRGLKAAESCGEKFFMNMTRRYIGVATILMFAILFAAEAVTGCKLFAASGSVTRDSITILAKNRDLYGESAKRQRIWYSPRATHSEEDTIHFRDISIPQCSLTYKFVATNSYVQDQTTGYGINEHGLAIISHDMDSWDDGSSGTEYFHDQDYVTLVLARCQSTSEAIDLFNDVILPHGINPEAYLIADPNGLWLLETTGHNYVAKPIMDDVVSSRQKRYNIRTEWSDPGNRHNLDLLANAAAHGCDTTCLDFAECFGNLSPGVIDPDLLALKERGNIVVQDMRELLRDKAVGGTVSACVFPVRPEKDAAFFSFMWDSRANPKYGNVFLPFWMAITDSALPQHYVSWPLDDPDCAWSMFTEIVEDSTLRAAAEPIWQNLQAELDAEFDSVENALLGYLNADDTLGLRAYVDQYVFGELDSAYDQAVDIIQKAGVPLPVVDLTAIKAAEHLMLQWSAVTLDSLGSPVTVDRYYVFREKDILSKPGVQPFDSTDVCWYLDTTGVVGDPTVAHRYWLVAAAGCRQSSSSAQVGAFDRSLNASRRSQLFSNDHWSFSLDKGPQIW
jgi:dipeptidase